MVESQVDSIEKFVNGLINNLVLEAMNILDANTEDADDCRRLHVSCAISGCEMCGDRKNRNLPLRMAQQRHKRVERTISSLDDQVRSSCLSEYPATAILSNDLWTGDGNLPFDVDQRASTEIRKIVEGLKGVQIGDSSMVKPVTQVPSLEMQVKRAVQEISNASEILEINEVPITEGQGDVYDGIHPKAMPSTDVTEVNNQKEDSLEKSERLEEDNSENEMQVQQLTQHQQRDVSKLRSTCFLHRIIKELDHIEANQENILKVSNSINGISQDRIAVWEEKEEKFIRTIEGSKEESLEDDMGDSIAISMMKEVPTDSIDNVKNQELNSTSVSEALPLSTPTNSSQCLGVKTEAILMQQHEAKPDKSKRKKKVRFGEKFRKFFRSAFNRGNDC